jgi:hypothetical protein
MRVLHRAQARRSFCITGHLSGLTGTIGIQDQTGIALAARFNERDELVPPNDVIDLQLRFGLGAGIEEGRKKSLGCLSRRSWDPLVRIYMDSMDVSTRRAEYR